MNNYRVVEHNPTGLPPEPSKENAEEILRGYDIDMVVLDDFFYQEADLVSSRSINGHTIIWF